MKRTHLSNSSIRGFTLIEMIGVLAIIGILASVVAPKVFDAIRDAKITAAMAVCQTIKGACTDFARKYNLFPEDGTKAPSSSYERPYGDKASGISAASANFGDLLISEGMLEKLVLPIGPAGSTAYNTGSITLTPASDPNGNDPGAFSNDGGIDYPVVLCRSYKSLNNKTRIFNAAQNSMRVVFLMIPGLTVLEAAGIKTKIDGPFSEDIEGASDIVTKTVAKNATGKSADVINRGNCRLIDGANNSYDAFIYVAHE